MAIPHITTSRSSHPFSDVGTRRDDTVRSNVVSITTGRRSAAIAPALAPTAEEQNIQQVELKEISLNNQPANEPSRAEDNILLSYYDIDHVKGRLFLHVWPDDKLMAFTKTDEIFNETEDYFVMILRFPFAAKGSYFATPSAFIDAGFADMELVEKYERLVELDLN